MERVSLSGHRSAAKTRRGAAGPWRVGAMLVALTLIAACRHGHDSRDTPPTAEPDSARTRPGATVEVDVLANDRDDGPMTVEIASPPKNASAAVTSTNLIRVSPAADFVGSVELTYVARDREGAASAPTGVSVDVTPTARTLVTVYDDQGRARHYLADTVESQLLGTSGGPRVRGNRRASLQLVWRRARPHDLRYGRHSPPSRRVPAVNGAAPARDAARR